MKQLNEKAQELKKELVSEMSADLENYLENDKKAMQVFNALCQFISD